MKKPILAFFLIVALTAAVPTGAEIFKYVDANGQTRWTDDLNQVPAEQRASVQRFESVENRPGNGLDPDPGATDPPPGATHDASAASAGIDPGTATDQEMRAALKNQKADLEAQYQALMEEREQIEQMTSAALSDAARNELNQRIATFNSQAEAYETDLNDFNQKVGDYNQKILSKKQPPPDD